MSITMNSPQPTVTRRDLLRTAGGATATAFTILRVGEEFTGTKGVLETSRNGMVHRVLPLPGKTETIPYKPDITVAAFEAFVSRIQSGEVENVSERAARSTMIGLLGRTAMYTGREATWKGEFGSDWPTTG